MDRDGPFVIIGGDAAGMSAASKAKREDPDLDVIVFEQGEWVSYAACGMPYYVKGVVDSLEDLVAITPQEIREERNIDLRTQHEVVDIDPDRERVTVETTDGTFEQPYGHLLIATGARAQEPPFDGFDLDGVFTLRSMNAADAIETELREQQPASAAIVGGGYIGIEMAEALIERGLEVAIFEMLPQTLEPFGEATARVVEDHLREEGVDLHLETAVKGFTGDGRVDGVEIDDGTVPADLVIVGVGVTPNVAVADTADIDCGPTGAIATDEFGETSQDGIYAAGDCAEDTNVVTGKPDYVPLGLTANRAGRAIGSTITGTPTTTGGTAGTAIVKAFELGAARTGIIDEQRAREAGFDPVSVTIDTHTGPEYYPGAAELTVSLVADRASHRVIGASVVGREGAKRIDTVATGLHAELTVGELERLDLAYAPPFSPVWDPILTAAKVLAGKLD